MLFSFNHLLIINKLKNNSSIILKIMKELKKSDLQIGDILIFENQDFDLHHFDELYKKDFKKAAFYLLLYMIPWFDPGEDPKNYKNIYHAAIWGNINVNRDKNQPIENLDRIVQAGTHGIDQASLDETLRGPGVKNIYVYRYKHKDASFSNNINKQIRNFYNDTTTPYSYETAWLLAVICSMRYSDGALHKILEKKIGKLKASFMIHIIKFIINLYNDNHQRKMVACSTLVAMIYKNAEHPLNIKNFIKDQPVYIPISFDSIKKRSVIDQPKDNNLPKVSVHETVVTPRQLVESSNMEALGYLPFRN